MRGWPHLRLFGLCGLILMVPGAESPTAQSLEMAPAAGASDRPVSGYHYMGGQIQALQDDDFLNPGIFAVERGEEIWSAVEGDKGLSCQSCHGDAADSMKGVAARYPQYDENSANLVNLESRINEMRATYMDASEFPLETDEMLSLAAYVAFQSRGMPMQVEISGEAKRFWDRGKEFYFTRRGQLDLSCSQCHDELAGRRLRGDTISQGHVNGFPFYRVQWGTMGSRHRMFRWCNWAVRAETHELGSPEYLSLELYLAWRGGGLPIEAPSVRP